MLADQHDYQSSTKDLPALTDECAEAEKLADDRAHYDAIHRDRKERIDKLTNPSGSSAVTQKIDAVKTKLADAEKLADGASPDYTKAVELLVPLAKECIDVDWVSDRAAAYQEKRNELDGHIKEYEKATNVAEVATWLTPLKTYYEDSDYSKTNDYVKSLILLQRAKGMHLGISRATGAHDSFKSQYETAKQAIDTLKNHAGKEAILPAEIQRLESDLAFADSKKVASEFVTAMNVCLKIVELAEPLTERADKCATYLKRKKMVADKRGGWTPTQDARVSTLADQVITFEASAAQAAADKNYDAAIKYLDQAWTYAINRGKLNDVPQEDRDLGAGNLFDEIHQAAKAEHERLITDQADADLDELKTSGQELDEASTAASNKDLNAAHGHLATAKENLVAAAKKVNAYKAFVDLRDNDIKSLTQKLTTPEGQAALDVEVQAYEQAVDEAGIDTVLGNMDEALATLQKAKKDGEILVSMLDECTKARAEKKSWVTDYMDNVDGPLVADLKQEVDTLTERLDKMFEERQFKQAGLFASTIHRVLKKAGDIKSADEKFKVERPKAEKKIEELKAVTCPAIAGDIDAAEKALAKADADVLQRNYKSAQQIVEKIPQDCVAPLKLGNDFKEYEPSLKMAKEHIQGLSKAYPRINSILLRVRELNDRLAGAEALAAKLDFAKAKDETDALLEAVVEATELGDAQKKIDQVATLTAAKKPTDLKGLEVQIRVVSNNLKKLVAHPGAGAVLEQRKTANERLSAALKTRTTDAPASQTALAEVASKVAEGTQIADQWAYLDGKVKAAIARSTTLRSTHAEPASLLRRLDALDKVLQLIRAGVDRAEFDSAMNMLQSAGSDTNAAEALGAAHKAYVEEKAKILPNVEKLAAHDHRYTVAKELGDAQAQLVKAAELAEAEKHPEAMAALAEAARICDSAEIKADMHGNKEIPEGKIKALLARTDGAAELDKIIETLDPQTQRKACKLALELRFDMKLEQYSDTEGKIADTDGDVPAPDVMKLYAVMKALPAAHTRDNPSVSLVKRMGDVVGESGYSKAKVIELRVGRITAKEEEVIGQEWQVGPVDENCKKVDGKPPKKFGWTTLHEIGHALDDKLGYMAKHSGDPNHGGWKEHGSDVGEIAAKANEKFKYNKRYVESYLSDPKGKIPIPAPENGDDQQTWDQRRIAAESWCDSVRVARSIWYNASDSARLKLDDNRVYQESYDNKWVSYDFSKRSQGVSGYQFRAPGEWFAEVYAAYYTGKMNPGHPARAWLEPLNK